jgi:molybdenum cofactor guanylyltransferase
VAPGAAPSLPDDVRLVHDPSAFEGPLVGLVAGVSAAREARLLVVGGDMPALRVPVLEALLHVLDDSTVAAAMLDRGGDVAPLPMALRRSAAVVALQPAVEAGERRLRAVRHLLPTTVLAEAVWRKVDPTGATVTDVDTPADLA